MKKLFPTLSVFFIAYLCLAPQLLAQDDGDIKIKITKDIDGKKSTFEGTYTNRSEMESDPNYKEFIGDDNSFSFHFDGDRGLIEIEEFLDGSNQMFGLFHSDEEGDNNFLFHVPDPDLEDMRSALKNRLGEMEERIKELNDDILDEEYMEELKEMINDLVNDRNITMITGRKSIRIKDVENNEFGEKGEVRSSELLDLEDLNFYPNPSDGRFKLKFKTPEAGKLEISVYDLEGSRVYNSLFENFNGWYQEQIDLSRRNKGIYLLEIKLNQKRMTKKIVLQ